MNERGFATITILALTPVLMAVLACLAGAYLLLQGDSELRHVCRVELLRSQKEASDALRELVALNPQAAIARAGVKTADKAFKASPNPITGGMVAAARTYQAYVAFQQKKFLLKGKYVSRVSPFTVSRKIHERLRLKQSRVEATDDGFRRTFGSASLDVVATPEKELTPDYQPSPQFAKKQNMTVSWSFDATALLPEWARTLLGTGAIRAAGDCSATLEKGGDVWVPKLSTDKRWLSSLSGFF